jgi:hypothetical protein
MSSEQSLYSVLEPDIAAVAEPLFELSEKFLRDRGNFLPHAAILTADGKVELVGALPDPSRNYTNSTEVLPLLHDGLRQMAKEKSLRAIGVAENVTVTPDGRPSTKAVKVLLEHSEGLAVASYLPFVKKLLRGHNFGEVFTILAAPEINAWRQA